MANQTIARDPQRQPGNILPYKAAAVNIFAGAAVSKNAAGFAKNAGDVSGETFLGVLDKTVLNSTGAAGAKTARVWKHGVFTFAFSGGSAAQADINAQVYFVDDQTVAKTTTNSVLAGRIVEVLSTTSVRVRIVTV